MAARRSSAEVAVSPRIATAIGQMRPGPVCGEPTPSPSRPRNIHGLAGESTQRRVATYVGSATFAGPEVRQGRGGSARSRRP